MRKVMWCIQWKTSTGAGLKEPWLSTVYISAKCSAQGWGHTMPGHYRHVWARTPRAALAKALGISSTTAKRWIEKGWAVVVE